MIIRAILPDWAKDKYPSLKKVVEGEFDAAKISKLNEAFYNIYYLPNYPSFYSQNETVDGSQIDTFGYVFVDMDLKEGKYGSKEEFLGSLPSRNAPNPSRVVDTGNGLHCYWRVSDLDAVSYLKLTRRMMRLLGTDSAVGQIYQLMRLPNTVNTKKEDDFKLCEVIYEEGAVYTCEQLNKALPLLTEEDERFCSQHYDKTYRLGDSAVSIEDKIPLKFSNLVASNKEVNDIWKGGTSDRSKSDYRLGHIMFAHNFTKEEAASVLVNTSKALSRAPIHRANYALNIIDKIWTYELEIDKSKLDLSQSVKDILEKSGDTIKGTRFPCHPWFDATERGFRLGDVLGLVAGSGVGKTSVALEMFEGFVRNNPEYVHFFVALEQPANEIADRWSSRCQGNQGFHDKVHVISNYTNDGSFRHLSLHEIKEYLLKFEKITGRKVGACVIDHIGALKKQSKDNENQGIVDICHEMKAFAIATQTFVIMQSQTNREKAGIGDLELFKDAAYGTVLFESYCDYMVTIWQPLKRVYDDGAPCITAYKFCKIRHKKQGIDNIKEDVVHRLRYEPTTERFVDLTTEDQKALEFHNHEAVNRRKKDRKTEVLTYKSMPWAEETDGKANNNKDLGGTSSANSPTTRSRVH